MADREVIVKTALGLLLAILGAMGAIAAEWPQPWPKPWPQPQVTEQPAKSPYQAAYDRYLNGETMVVFLTASWCAPCQRAKRHIPSFSRLGAFVEIDIDRERQLANQIAGGESFTIPRVIVFRHGRPTATYLGRDLDALAAYGASIP